MVSRGVVCLPGITPKPIAAAFALPHEDSLIRLEVPKAMDRWWAAENSGASECVQLSAMKAFQRAQVVGLQLLAVSLFCYFGSAVLAEQVKDLPKPTDYVSDFAHVLSPQAVAQLDSICSQLDHSKANAQIAVVTVHNLDGDDAADFANELEDKWKIGRKGSDRGVLVLLAVDDHKYRIDVGYGLEGILTDGKVGDIGREMVPVSARQAIMTAR